MQPAGKCVCIAWHLLLYDVWMECGIKQQQRKQCQKQWTITSGHIQQTVSKCRFSCDGLFRVTHFRLSVPQNQPNLQSLTLSLAFPAFPVTVVIAALTASLHIPHLPEDPLGYSCKVWPLITWTLLLLSPTLPVPWLHPSLYLICTCGTTSLIKDNLKLSPLSHCDAYTSLSTSGHSHSHHSWSLKSLCPLHISSIIRHMLFSWFHI